jgi:hypothetical protein
MRAHSSTSISVERDGRARISVHLLPDQGMSVLVSEGKAWAQISLSHCDAHVIIAPTDSAAPTAEDLQVARRLAQSFAVYAAEVERLHAQHDQTAKSAAEPAA